MNYEKLLISVGAVMGFGGFITGVIGRWVLNIDAIALAGVIVALLGVSMYLLARKLQQRPEDRSHAGSVGRCSPSGRSVWVTDDLFICFQRSSLGLSIPIKLNTEWDMYINGKSMREVLPKTRAEIPFDFEGKKYVVHWSSMGTDDSPNLIVRDEAGLKLAPV